MKKPINPLITPNFIDSCAFDPKNDVDEVAASAEIFRLSEEFRLGIHIAHSTQKEIDYPNTPSWVKRKAKGLNHTLLVSLTIAESSQLRKIETILAGNGKVENILQDANHIFEAQKYGSYFITTDKRILDKASELHKIGCQVTILKPSQFLAIVKEYLALDEPIINITNSDWTQSLSKKYKDNKKSYKGYEITASPYTLPKPNEWIAHFTIRRLFSDSKGKPLDCYPQGFFKTTEEAVEYCIDMGKQVIDGKVENCSVKDL